MSADASRLATICGHTLFVPDIDVHSVVVDVGANRGLFSSELAARFGCRCHAIEASPDLYARLPRRPDVENHHLAIAGETGTRSFRVAEDCEASTLFELADAATTRVASVRSMDLATFVAAHDINRIDVLKLDIEGAEIETLDAAPDALLQSITMLSVEFHDFNGRVGRHTIARIRRRLRKLGFRCFRFSKYDHADTLFLNARLSRGRVRDRLTLRLFPYVRWARRVFGRPLGRRRLS